MMVKVHRVACVCWEKCTLYSDMFITHSKTVVTFGLLLSYLLSIIFRGMVLNKNPLQRLLKRNETEQNFCLNVSQ